LRKLLTSVSAGAKDFGRSEGVRLVSKSDWVGSWITFLLLKLLGRLEPEGKSSQTRENKALLLKRARRTWGEVVRPPEMVFNLGQSYKQVLLDDEQFLQEVMHT